MRTYSITSTTPWQAFYQFFLTPPQNGPNGPIEPGYIGFAAETIDNGHSRFQHYGLAPAPGIDALHVIRRHQRAGKIPKLYIGINPYHRGILRADLDRRTAERREMEIGPLTAANAPNWHAQSGYAQALILGRPKFFRRKDAAAELINLAIDLDLGRSGRPSADAGAAEIARLITAGHTPAPAAIIRSGRGLHLWYRLAPDPQTGRPHMHRSGNPRPGALYASTHQHLVSTLDQHAKIPLWADVRASSPTNWLAAPGTTKPSNGRSIEITAHMVTLDGRPPDALNLLDYARDNDDAMYAPTEHPSWMRDDPRPQRRRPPATPRRGPSTPRPIGDLLTDAIVPPFHAPDAPPDAPPDPITPLFGPGRLPHGAEAPLAQLYGALSIIGQAGGIFEGHRYNTLFDLGKLAQSAIFYTSTSGDPPERTKQANTEAKKFMHQVNARWCRPPLPHHECPTISQKWTPKQQCTTTTLAASINTDRGRLDDNIQLYCLRRNQPQRAKHARAQADARTERAARQAARWARIDPYILEGYRPKQIAAALPQDFPHGADSAARQYIARRRALLRKSPTDTATPDTATPDRRPGRTWAGHGPHPGRRRPGRRHHDPGRDPPTS